MLCSTDGSTFKELPLLARLPPEGAEDSHADNKEAANNVVTSKLDMILDGKSFGQSHFNVFTGCDIKGVDVHGYTYNPHEYTITEEVYTLYTFEIHTKDVTVWDFSSDNDTDDDDNDDDEIESDLSVDTFVLHSTGDIGNTGNKSRAIGNWKVASRPKRIRPDVTFTSQKPCHADGINRSNEPFGETGSCGTRHPFTKQTELYTVGNDKEKPTVGRKTGQDATSGSQACEEKTMLTARTQIIFSTCDSEGESIAEGQDTESETETMESEGRTAERGGRSTKTREPTTENADRTMGDGEQTAIHKGTTVDNKHKIATAEERTVEGEEKLAENECRTTGRGEKTGEKTMGDGENDAEEKEKLRANEERVTKEENLSARNKEGTTTDGERTTKNEEKMTGDTGAVIEDENKTTEDGKEIQENTAKTIEDAEGKIVPWGGRTNEDKNRIMGVRQDATEDSERAADDRKDITEDEERATKNKEKKLKDTKKTSAGHEETAEKREQNTEDKDNTLEDEERAIADGQNITQDGEEMDEDKENTTQKKERTTEDANQTTEALDRTGGNKERTLGDVNEATEDREWITQHGDIATKSRESSIENDDKNKIDKERAAVDRAKAASDGEKNTADGDQTVEDRAMTAQDRDWLIEEASSRWDGDRDRPTKAARAVESEEKPTENNETAVEDVKSETKSTEKILEDAKKIMTDEERRKAKTGERERVDGRRERDEEWYSTGEGKSIVVGGLTTDDADGVSGVHRGARTKVKAWDNVGDFEDMTDSGFGDTSFWRWWGHGRQHGYDSICKDFEQSFPAGRELTTVSTQTEFEMLQEFTTEYEEFERYTRMALRAQRQGKVLSWYSFRRGLSEDPDNEKGSVTVGMGELAKDSDIEEEKGSQAAGLLRKVEKKTSKQSKEKTKRRKKQSYSTQDKDTESSETEAKKETSTSFEEKVIIIATEGAEESTTITATDETYRTGSDTTDARAQILTDTAMNKESGLATSTRSAYKSKSSLVGDISDGQPSDGGQGECKVSLVDQGVQTLVTGGTGMLIHGHSASADLGTMVSAVGSGTANGAGGFATILGWRETGRDGVDEEEVADVGSIAKSAGSDRRGFCCRVCCAALPLQVLMLLLLGAACLLPLSEEEYGCIRANFQNSGFMMLRYHDGHPPF